ncbi:MAG: hypothetical protein AB7I27_09860 [Bacteriovoracaceae bacterium]
MKYMLLSLIALLMAILPANSAEVQGLNSLSQGESIISSATFFGQKPLRDQSTKNTTRFNYIAQAFIPIVEIADFSYQVSNHSYYLPLYNKSRQKVFFLLI